MKKTSVIALFIFATSLTKIYAEESGSQDSLKKEEFREFISKNTAISLKNGKIEIAPHIKHVKLDIGLSYSAPMSQYWLSHENDLLVFGFEPNPEAIHEIRHGAVKRHLAHGEPLEVKYINRNFFLVPCALGGANESKIRLYVTKEDCGCSSIYEPKSFEVSKTVDVPIFSLSNFFDLFPFEAHPVIDYIKIDAQGSDLDIIKSAGNYLKDHVVYITLEPENHQYKNTKNSIQEIENYMHSIGFVRFYSKNTRDPTYFNKQFLDYVNTHNIQIFQM